MIEPIKDDHIYIYNLTVGNLAVRGIIKIAMMRKTCLIFLNCGLLTPASAPAYKNIRHESTFLHVPSRLCIPSSPLVKA
jgi:hypothetical protein